MTTASIRPRILGYIFLLERKLDAICNREFGKVGLTTKQWFVLISLGEVGEGSSISMVADKLSTSHQNIKRMALQLQRKGFVDIVQDDNDKRRLNLYFTRECKKMWNERDEDDTRTIAMLTSPLSDSEAQAFLDMLERLTGHLDNI